MEDVSLFKYWQPVLLEEHRLFSKEIAQMWGVFSIHRERENPHNKMVYAILERQEYEMRQNPLFFQTRGGLTRCFGRDVIARGLRDLLTHSTDMGTYYIYENLDIKFKYKRKEGAMKWDIG